MTVCFVLSVVAVTLWVCAFHLTAAQIDSAWINVIATVGIACLVIGEVIGWKQWNSRGQFFLWLFPLLLLLLLCLWMMLSCPSSSLKI